MRRPLCHLAFRDYPPADTHQPGHEVLAAVHARLSHRGRPGSRQRRRGAQAVARTGLLLAGTQSPRRSTADSGARNLSRYLPGDTPPQGSGRLHRCRHRLDGFRAAPCRRRRKCLSHPCPHLRHLDPHRLYPGQARVSAVGRRALPDRRGRLLEPGHDGLWRPAVQTQRSRVRQLPVCRHV